ncbi:MAG: class I SAM-dependent methyltransferase [Chloroflexota bacterium]
MAQISLPKTRFDDEADVFDKRTGLSDTVAQNIAQIIAETIQPTEHHQILEIGAGTGEIGIHLSQLGAAYVGMDLSRPMLDVFEGRVSSLGERVRLVQADANEQWPAPDQSVNIIFSSRALHLFGVEHIIGEFMRVGAGDYAVLLIGRVLRDKQSVKQKLRRKMLALVESHGIQGNLGRGHSKQLINTCVKRGMSRFDPHVAASWAVSSAPIDSINSWETKPGLAGREMDRTVKQDILSQLRVWAEGEYGQLDQPIQSEEQYIVEGVWLHQQ